MSLTCPPAPENKKAYISDIGKLLVATHGKKKYYKPKEVKKAHRRSRWYDGLDFSCWAMCTYSSHDDFDNYHRATGESCDYVAMKTEMLGGLGTSSITDWSGVEEINLDASWLDFGDLFDGLIEGIGDLIEAIFD